MSEHIQLAQNHPEIPPALPEEQQRTPGVSHESDAFDFRLILWSGAALALIGGAVCFAASWLLEELGRYHAASFRGVLESTKKSAEKPLGQRLEDVPSPHLEGMERRDSPNDIAEARKRAEAKMEQYGWVDRNKEIVHVPIEKAMEYVLRSKEFGSPGRTRRESKRPANAGDKR